MASSATIFIVFNTLLFTMVASTYVPCPPPPSKLPPSHSGGGGHGGGSGSGSHGNKPPTSPGTKATCPRDTLKLAVCANVLNGLVNVVVGTPPKAPCCSLIDGLTDLEAAVCLCTAIKANVLGVKLNVPVSLSLLINYCGKKVPSGFRCA